MIILGIGGILSDAAAAVLKDGELAAPSKNRNSPRRGSGPAAVAGAGDRSVPGLAGVSRGPGRCVAIVRPFAGPEFAASEAARAVSEQPHRAGGSSPRRTRPRLIYASPFRRGHGADARPRRRFPLRLALARPRHAALRSSRSSTTPIRSAISIGRVTELLGFDASADEHKVQWLSATGDDRYRELFLEILGMTNADGRASTAPSSTPNA